MRTPRATPQSGSVIIDAIIDAVAVSAHEIDDVRSTFDARGFEINNDRGAANGTVLPGRTAPGRFVFVQFSGLSC